MDMRRFGIVIMAAGALQSLAGSAHADKIEFGISTNPSSYGVAEIQVDGPSASGPYTDVLNDKLDYILSLKSGKPENATDLGHFSFYVDSKSPLGGFGSRTKYLDGWLTHEWLQYKVSIPYVDPWSHQFVNQRTSPVQFCNESFQNRDGAARQQMLKYGFSSLYQGAYSFLVTASFDDYLELAATDLVAPVKITCLPLDRIRPHTQSTTKPAGQAPKPQAAKPTVSEVSLRIEPAQIVQDGKFLCPQQLKLYGHVEVIRKFGGKSIFVGPHFLSPISALSFQAAGERTNVATYAMDWHKMGGLTTSPNAEPKKQKLTFRFNVSNKDGKLLDSAEKTIEVSCRKIKVNAPTGGDGMTVAPAN